MFVPYFAHERAAASFFSPFFYNGGADFSFLLRKKNTRNLSRQPVTVSRVHVPGQVALWVAHIFGEHLEEQSMLVRWVVASPQAAILLRCRVSLFAHFFLFASWGVQDFSYFFFSSHPAQLHENPVQRSLRRVLSLVCLVYPRYIFREDTPTQS